MLNIHIQEKEKSTNFKLNSVGSVHPYPQKPCQKKKITVQEFKMWQYTDGENCLALGITRKACGVITGIKEMKLSWNTMASDERKIWDSTWRNDLHHATYFSEQNKFDITK